MGGAAQPIGQAPSTHVPPLQDVPQAPQFAGSVSRSEHVLVARQYVSVATAQPHVALWHVSGATQIEPGHVLPQWSGSLLRSTHPVTPPQFVSPAAHVQAPALQA